MCQCVQLLGVPVFLSCCELQAVSCSWPHISGLERAVEGSPGANATSGRARAHSLPRAFNNCSRFHHHIIILAMFPAHIEVCFEVRHIYNNKNTAPVWV